MIIDRLLAQSIVDRSMSIIDTNVNVMDAQGIIIASGDLKRVGQRHEGAMLVLSKQGPVEIDADLSRQLEAVRPGVNLPLRSEGRIVGCVGLTGAPDTIRQHAELVRMTAESMLEQAQLLHLLARDARLREELALSLIRGETLTPSLLNWARQLGINIALPRVVAVIELDSSSLDIEATLFELQRLHTLLGTPERDNLIATVSLNELVVLKPALNKKGEWDLVAQRQRAAYLLARMKEISPLRIRIALGHYFPGEGGVARSYQVARTTLAIGKHRQPDGSAFFYADLTLPVLLDGLRQGWQADELLAPLQPLKKQDRQGQLLRTLIAWFANGMHMAETAKSLRVHRNTLDYRMRRIQDLCVVDLARTEDRMRLYLALQMSGDE